MAAMKDTQQYHRNVQPLLTQLQVMKACNQKELVGILKFNDSLSPSVSQVQWSTSLSIAAYCAKHDFKSIFPDEMEAARPQWDRALVACFEAMHRDGIELASFVKLYSKTLPLVANLSDVECLLDRKGPWSGVREALARVVAASLIGKRMFSFAMVHIIAFEVSEAIDAGVQRAFSGSSPCTVQRIGSLKQGLLAKVQKKVGIDLLPQRRLVTVTYRGVAFKVHVDSVYDELDKKIAAEIKSAAVNRGDLAPLLCEAALVPLDAAKASQSVDDELLTTYRLVRQQAFNLLDGQPWTSGEDLVELMVDKQLLFVQMDPSFGVDLEFFRAMSGEVGTLVLQERILQCLPSDGKQDLTLGACAEMLRNLMSSDVYRFCNASAKGSLAMVKDIIGALQMKVAPPLSLAKGNEFYEKVVASLAFFISHSPPGAQAASDVTYGKPAVDAKFQRLLDMDAKKEAVKLEDLAEFNMYSFLLAKNQQEKVEHWTKAIVNTMCLAKKPLAIEPEAASSSSSKKAKKAIAVSATDAAMDFVE